MNIKWEKNDYGFSYHAMTPVGRITIAHESTPLHNQEHPDFCVILPDKRRLRARARTANELFHVVEKWLRKVAMQINEMDGSE